jgi:single-stranded-DNA-specific exonuclease
VPELLARILAGRGIEVDAVTSFLDPTVRALMPDPDSLADMRTAAVRLADAIMRGETIAILGDYDVDGATIGGWCWGGICSTAAFVRSSIFPDRLFEGYGPNVERSARSPRAGRRSWSQSIAAPRAMNRCSRRASSASTSS